MHKVKQTQSSQRLKLLFAFALCKYFVNSAVKLSLNNFDVIKNRSTFLAK